MLRLNLKKSSEQKIKHLTYFSQINYQFIFLDWEISPSFVF